MEKIEKREWIYLIAGTALMAIGTEGFFEQANLVAGGITGIGIMLNGWAEGRFALHLPLWLVNLLLNLPLFLIAWKRKGWAFVSKTILTAGLFSLMLYLEQIFPISSADPLLAAVFGGAAVGVGLGLVLSAEATTGGVDLAAALLHLRLPGISVARLIFILDAAIIGAGMTVFGVESSLYAILAVFVTEQCMVWALEGMDFARGAWIISEKGEALRAAFLEELHRSPVVFQISDPLVGEKEKALFCVFSQKEVPLAKSIIMNIDRKAFFLITDIREVLGEGLEER